MLDGPTMEEDQKKKYLVYVGDTVTLICGTGLIGNPKPTVAWTNPQGRSVQGNEGRYVLSTKPDVTLTINGITENDGAIWKCTVEVNSNDLSVACPDPNAPNRTLEIKVVVIGKLLMILCLNEFKICMLVYPVRPSEPNQIKVVPVNETDVLVSWDRPTQPGSPVLTGYKLCFNGTCDMNVKGESADVGVPHLEENKCYDVTVHAVSESEGEPVEGPHSDHVWVVTGKTRMHTICIL